jgi:hypothetical protein
MSWIKRAVRAFEVCLFGDYTGTPEARREWCRRRLLGMGYRSDIVNQVIREAALEGRWPA